MRLKKHFAALVCFAALVSACGGGREQPPGDSAAAVETVAGDPAVETADGTGAVTVQIIVNENAVFSLSGYAADSRHYFLLADIANALAGTQAQFDFGYGQGGFTIDRGVPLSPAQPDTSSGEVSPAVRLVSTGLVADRLTGSFNVLDTPLGVHFALEDLAGFLGFNIDRGGAAGLIRIDTGEPNISLQGRVAVQNFLSERATLFTRDWDENVLAASVPLYMPDIMAHWPSGYLYPVSFILHDFNGTGIPDILVHYDAPPWAVFHRYVLYTYVDGVYVRGGTVSMWGEFFRDAQGRVFSFEGSHHDGWAEVRLLSVETGGATWEPVISHPWPLWGAVSDDEFERLSEEFQRFWQGWSFFSPSSPFSPNEPLTSIRPLSALQGEVLAGLQN
ncbi:MAG: hypothetical protein FWG66_09475 [Spirochaetes bacterium]|nr:hypothetical protein [Spirochaetota bacterium]